MRKRVIVLREITYEGPEVWVNQTLQKMIRGTFECGPGKTVSSRLLDQKTEVIEPNPIFNDFDFDKEPQQK